MLSCSQSQGFGRGGRSWGPGMDGQERSKERRGGNRWWGVTICAPRPVTSAPAPRSPCLRPQSSQVLRVEASPAWGSPCAGSALVFVCVCFCSFVVRIQQKICPRHGSVSVRSSAVAGGTAVQPRTPECSLRTHSSGRTGDLGAG